MQIIDFFRKYTRSISRSLFLKFFLGYVLVTLLLAAAIGFYTQFYILENLDAEIERFEKKKITETLNTLDVLFGEMEKQALNQAMNDKILQFAYVPRQLIPQKWAEIKSVQDLLASSLNSSNYVTNIGVFYEKNGYILDYSGLIDLDDYYDRSWYIDYLKMTGYSAILDTRKVAARLSTSSSLYNNTITFLAQIPYDSQKREGAVVLSVDERLVSNQLRIITQGDDQALAFIVNAQGTIIASSQEKYLYQKVTQTLNMPDIYLELAAGDFSLTREDTDMICYFDSSGRNQWKMFYVVSRTTMYEKSLTIRNITYLTFFGLVLLMGAISLFFSRKIYDPIKRIISNIRRISPVNHDGMSDASMIQNEIVTLLENNQSLEKQLGDNKILVRESFLSQLIAGQQFNLADIRERAAYLSINLNYEWFKVAVIKVRPTALQEMAIKERELKKAALLSTVEKIFSNLNLDLDCVHDPDDNLLVLLKLDAYRNLDETDALTEQTLEDFQNSVGEYLKLAISIGAGRIQRGILGIGVSYKEALEALRYEFLYDDSPVVSYARIAGSRTDLLHYPVEMEQKLITLINLGDYEKTSLTLGAMLDDIMNNNKSFPNIEICLLNIVGIIQRCVYELNVNLKDVFTEDGQINPPISQFKNIQQFKEWISQKFRSIIEYRIDQQKGSAGSLITDVKKYIEEKYTEEISLVSVSGHFNYNPSYFCKTFKEKAGISFWDYVSKIRIDKSKALLSDTGISIEQIAGMVGYNNRFSFIRTFKKQVAITPGEYRTRFSNSRTEHG